MQENNNNHQLQDGVAEARAHTLTIEERKKITMTGVESVTAFSPQQISLNLSGGKLVITGSDLKITAFSKTSGTFSATGNISSLRYGGAGVHLSGLFR